MADLSIGLELELRIVSDHFVSGRLHARGAQACDNSVELSQVLRVDLGREQVSGPSDQPRPGDSAPVLPCGAVNSKSLGYFTRQQVTMLETLGWSRAFTFPRLGCLIERVKVHGAGKGCLPSCARRAKASSAVTPADSTGFVVSPWSPSRSQAARALLRNSSCYYLGLLSEAPASPANTAPTTQRASARTKIILNDVTTRLPKSFPKNKPMSAARIESIRARTNALAVPGIRMARALARLNRIFMASVRQKSSLFERHVQSRSGLANSAGAVRSGDRNDFPQTPACSGAQHVSVRGNPHVGQFGQPDAPASLTPFDDPSGGTNVSHSGDNWHQPTNRPSSCEERHGAALHSV